MKRFLICLLSSLIVLAMTGCTISLADTPTPFSPFSLPSPTPAFATDTQTVPTPVVPTATLALPTLTPAAATATNAAPTVTSGPTTTSGPTATPTTGGIQPGSPSGPYAVIGVGSGEVLNIRSTPSTAGSVAGTFPAAATNVMRTGPSIQVDTDLWVQVQNPSGGTGWVNAAYLTEYVPSATFCADTHVNTLLSNFGNAVQTSNGGVLAALVSPAHGMTVRLWRNGTAVVFDQSHAQFVFVSTYEHDWGAAPGSGLDTTGSFHVAVLPKWLDVFNGSPTLSCDAVQTGGASYDTSWPAELANLNFYSIYKPGPTGNENSWRTLLIGVEYVQGKPYIYSVTQLEWEP
ncbi:MAG TPA: SH3 domain-containing protein [Anaerolineales bacterium]|nr:SH3 domain-containing protein [Anaerolineales bacterium]